jgi:uncharacterized protein
MYPPIVVHAGKGNLDKVIDLLENDPTLLEASGHMDQTPLFMAVRWGQFEVVKYLVGKGANINVKDKNGTSAIIDAAVGNHFEVVEYLKEHGATFDENIMNRALGANPLVSKPGCFGLLIAFAIPAVLLMLEIVEPI